MTTKLDEMVLRHRNVEASDDLVLGVQLVGAQNTDVIREHIRQNSKLDLEWVEEAPEKSASALICGAAPSLADCIEDIRQKKESGAVIYACNSAALVLKRNGIESDYQVILDPDTRENEVWEAREYLFASVVPPVLFDRHPDAKLWHPLMDGIEELIPAHRTFCGIGGGITVSNFALCLSYTMGHREIHCYGMDSSFREGKTHAAENIRTDGALHVEVEHNGRIYKTSFDMKQQVVVFLALANLLEEAGAVVRVHGSGLLPDAWRDQFTHP